MTPRRGNCDPVLTLAIPGPRGPTYAAPPTRFTLRGLMLVVAILAMLLGVWLWGERRRARFSALAWWHDRQVVLVWL